MSYGIVGTPGETITGEPGAVCNGTYGKWDGTTCTCRDGTKPANGDCGGGPPPPPDAGIPWSTVAMVAAGVVAVVAVWKIK